METLRSEQNKKKKAKVSQNKTSPFPWKKHEQTLKDIILKNPTEYLEPDTEGFVNIANEMANTYQIENVTAEKVRIKYRTEGFKKWLKKQGKKESPKSKKKRKRDASSSEEDSSSASYSDSENSDDDSEMEMNLSSSLGRGFAAQPIFWSISDFDCWWYFMRRKWKIEAQHLAGRQYIELEYKIDPPSVFEIQKLVKKSNQESLKTLDINKPNIQNQIKEWKPITWKVALSTPLPLLPSLYRAAREDEYSWIQVPRNNPRRSTVFGDEEIDIDYAIQEEVGSGS